MVFLGPPHTFPFLSLLTWRMNSRDVNPLSTPRCRIKCPLCVGGRNPFELIAGRSRELGVHWACCAEGGLSILCCPVVPKEEGGLGRGIGISKVAQSLGP